MDLSKTAERERKTRKEEANTGERQSHDLIEVRELGKALVPLASLLAAAVTGTLEIGHALPCRDLRARSGR